MKGKRIVHKWKLFRISYRKQYLPMLRKKSRIDAESRLDIAERIVKPETIDDMAHSLDTLQSQLYAGAEGRFGRQRSTFTVKGYVKAVRAALNWAKRRGWLESVPEVERVKTPRMKAKGRPLTEAEFQRMLAAVPEAFTMTMTAKNGKLTELRPTDELVESWRHVLLGYWESGLRLGELLNVHWTDEAMIHPCFIPGMQPTLYIPAELQKNNVEEEIPLLPGFASLLLQTPPEKRRGWVFNPQSLQLVANRKGQRPNAERVGKAISRIGKTAGIVVKEANPRTMTPRKYASAHNLRRSLAQRLMLAGVDPHLITLVVRHQDWKTTAAFYALGDVQASAARLWETLQHDRKSNAVEAAESMPLLSRQEVMSPAC